MFGLTFKKDSKDIGGKPLMSEFIPEFFEEMGKILEEGRVKYGYKNWCQCPEDEEFHYQGAMLRHAFESMKLHGNRKLRALAATAVNCMFQYYFTMKRENCKYQGHIPFKNMQWVDNLNEVEEKHEGN